MAFPIEWQERGLLLSGVWMGDMEADKAEYIYDSYHEHDASETWLVLLDGRLWRITEDPDDGYRSHCRDIKEVTDVMPVNWWQTSERVAGHYVTRWPKSIAYWRGDIPTDSDLPWWEDDYSVPPSEELGYYFGPDEHEECELMVFVSCVTNKVVCIFGTANTGDYYPCFVAKFYPQNMGINAALINIVGEIDE